MMKKMILAVLLFIISLSLFADNPSPQISVNTDVSIKGYYNPQYSSELSIWAGDLTSALATRVSGGAFNPPASIPQDGIVTINNLTLNSEVTVFTWYLENGSNKKMRISFSITPLQAEIEIKNSQGFITGHKYYIPKYTIYMKRGDKNSTYSKTYSMIEPYNNSQKGVDSLIFTNIKWDGLFHHDADKGIYGYCTIKLQELTDDPGTFEYIAYVTVELAVE